MGKQQIADDRKAEQQAIRDICNRVRKSRNLKWPAFWQDVIGINVGIDYEKNFTNGEAGLDTAASIKNWIVAHEPDLAFKCHPAHFPRIGRTGWQGFCETHGMYGALNTVPFEPLTLHEISTRNPISPVQIKLGQEFTFELDCLIFGSVIALDCYKGSWYPIPLHENHGFTPIPIKNGVYGFPIKDNDPAQIIPMRQRSFDGEHGHCFIVGPDQLMGYFAKHFVIGESLSLPFLDRMAGRLNDVEQHKLSIHLENVIFK